MSNDKPAYIGIYLDKIVSGEGIPGNVDKVDELMMIIGSKEEIEPRIHPSGHGKTELFNYSRKNVELVKEICTRNITAVITLSIDGYDNDPRELWEIPQTVLYIKLFGSMLKVLGYPPDFFKRLSPESIKWAEITHEAPTTKQ